MDSLSSDEIKKKAKGYALRLFKLRPRSEFELGAKMRGKGYDEAVVALVTAEFKAQGYLDDVLFARLWLESRLKKYGLRRVARELAQNGIAKDTIAALGHEAGSGHDETAVA
ncbi:MAG: regulatory protein RecX, partial [Candidatus Omnitrophica bacterium]|nr:regulatory protein RecX [Candidatus Omnitrophota bacterium]